MDFGTFYWILIGGGLVVELVGGWGAYDVLKVPEAAWDAAGRDRVKWLIWFVVVGPFVLPFYVRARADVRRAWAALPPPPAWGPQPPPPVRVSEVHG